MATKQVSLPPLETATPEEAEIIRRFAELTVYADQNHADVLPQHQRVFLAAIRAARMEYRIVSVSAGDSRNFSGREVDPDAEHSESDPAL